MVAIMPVSEELNTLGAANAAKAGRAEQGCAGAAAGGLLVARGEHERVRRRPGVLDKGATGWSWW